MESKSDQELEDIVNYTVLQAKIQEAKDARTFKTTSNDGIVAEALAKLNHYIDQQTTAAKIAELELMATKRKPTHGNCCTCQDCGYYHDDCRCELIAYAENRLAELRENQP